MTDSARLDWLLPNLHPANFGLVYDADKLDDDHNAEWRAAIDAAMAAASSGEAAQQSASVHPAVNDAEPGSQIAGRDGASAAPSDEGSDARLPYDVKIDSVTFRKGVPLSTFILAATEWRRAAFPGDHTLTTEQKAALLARLQGRPANAHPLGCTCEAYECRFAREDARQVAHSSQAHGELSVGPVVTNNDRMNEENQNG